MQAAGPPHLSFSDRGISFATNGDDALPAYAAETAAATPQSRFVLWFNGNGIPERYWIPAEEGTDYRMLCYVREL